jgi:hypothetical protein
MKGTAPGACCSPRVGRSAGTLRRRSQRRTRVRFEARFRADRHPRRRASGRRQLRRCAELLKPARRIPGSERSGGNALLLGFQISRLIHRVQSLRTDLSSSTPALGKEPNNTPENRAKLRARAKAGHFSIRARHLLVEGDARRSYVGGRTRSGLPITTRGQAALDAVREAAGCLANARLWGLTIALVEDHSTTHRLSVR